MGYPIVPVFIYFYLVFKRKY